MERVFFFFQTHPILVDQSKSIGEHWKWDSSEITAPSRTHLTSLIEILVQKALKCRPASVCSGYRAQRARRFHSPRSAFAEKKEQPFSVAAAFIQSATRFRTKCRRFYSTALVREQKREVANSPRGGKILGKMYQPLYDEHLESESLFTRDIRAVFYDNFVPKWIVIFFSLLRGIKISYSFV